MAAQLQHAAGGVHPARQRFISRRVRIEQHPALARRVAILGQQAGQQLVAAQRPAEAQPAGHHGGSIGRINHLGIVRALRLGQAD